MFALTDLILECVGNLRSYEYGDIKTHRANSIHNSLEEKKWCRSNYMHDRSYNDAFPKDKSSTKALEKIARSSDDNVDKYRK